MKVELRAGFSHPSLQLRPNFRRLSQRTEAMETLPFARTVADIDTAQGADVDPILESRNVLGVDNGLIAEPLREFALRHILEFVPADPAAVAVDRVDDHPPVLDMTRLTVQRKEGRVAADRDDDGQ